MNIISLELIFSIVDDRMCIFDYAETGNKDIALVTATANVKFKNDSEVLGQ